MPLATTPVYSVIVYDLTFEFKLVPNNLPLNDALAVAAAINGTVEPMSWESMGGQGVLRLVLRQGGTNKAWLLIVRQTEEIQGKVREVLTGMKEH